MRIIRPISILDANLVSSNISEADYPDYNVSETVVIGTRRKVVSANVHLVYESLQSGNVGHVPGATTPDPWWIKVSPTNRWEMFDNSVQSQSTNPDSIDITLLPLSRVDSVCLLNVDASSVRIKQTDPIEGVIYDVTTPLTSSLGITDWYAYFFEPIVRKGDFVMSALKPYPNATVQVTLTSPGNTVSLGVAILGLSRTFGATQYGAKLGILDYSLKQKDTFGNYSVLQRAYSKYAEITVWLDNTLVDQFQQVLASYRATPIVYVGSDSFESSFIYGFYKDFSTVIEKPTVSICSITLEGLT